METRLLRSFLAVARLESFTGAALELGYTQSTVTGHVKKLEQRLGCRLLDRMPQGVQVTEAGARLIPHADDLLAAEDRILAVSAGDDARPAGTVRVLAPESLCTYRLPGLVRAIRETEPLVQVWLSPGGLTDAVEAVRKGSADIVLSLESCAPATGLDCRRIGAEPLAIIDHPANSPAAATWEDLARRDALLVEEGCGYSDDIAALLETAGEEAGRRSRFGSVEAIKRCVAVGLGWSAVLAVTVEEELTAGTLIELPGPDVPDCDVYELTHPRRYRSAATAAVKRQLQALWAS